MTANGHAGDKEYRAYPFAVSRTPELDWRPCLGPRHMVAQGGEYFLVHAADPGDQPCPSPVFERIVTTKRYGELTLVARSLPATADLIGGSPEEQLLDRAGRPIQLIEGLVVPGRHPGCAAHWQDQLPSVHEMAKEAFPEFWRSEDEAAPPAPSQPLIKPKPRALPGTDPDQDTQGRASAAGTSADTGQITTDSGDKSPGRGVVISVITVIVGVAILYVIIRIARR
jgi:hypothetical protein